MRKDGIERHDAILDAALACFCERGVLGTGIEEIRRRAGASPSSVYHFFEDLNGITVALLARTFERLFTRLAERITIQRSARSTVLTLVDAHLEWVLAHKAEARFMYQATALELAPEAGERLQARKNELIAPLLAHIAPYVAKGTLPSWSPIEIDVVVLGPSHEACRRYLAGGGLSTDWMRETLPRLAWKTVSREARR